MQHHAASCNIIQHQPTIYGYHPHIINIINTQFFLVVICGAETVTLSASPDTALNLTAEPQNRLNLRA
jgi:hypothetical protein